MQDDLSARRRFLKIGGSALALFPIVFAAGRANAGANSAMRGSLKYQAKAEGDKTCLSCMHFVAGTTAKDLGGCKIMPGDSEVSPQGYCAVWAKKS